MSTPRIDYTEAIADAPAAALIFADDGFQFGVIECDDLHVTNGTAAHIVRCVNAHDDLVALALAIEKLKSSPMQADYVPPAIQALASTALAKVS